MDLLERYVSTQVMLSVSAYAVAKVFSLTAAAEITTVALQALGLVAATALILNLVGCKIKSHHSLSKDINDLRRLQCVFTVGLFAIDVVAAPVAQYGIICALSGGALSKAC